MNDIPSKLNELSDKSADKNGGPSANYLLAFQALRDDLLTMFNSKFDSLTQEIATIKQDLTICNEELKASTERELNLLKQISKQAQNTNPDKE